MWRLALALTLVVGCEKSGKKIPDDPQPRPAALIVAVSLPAANALESLADVASAIQPQAALVVNSGVLLIAASGGVGAKSLDGLDTAQPIHALWLDDGKLRGLAIVGRIKDDDALDDAVKPATVVRKDGWAVIAQKDVAEAVAPYALTTVVAARPAVPTARIYMRAVVARYNDLLVAIRTQMLRSVQRKNPQSAAVVTPYLDGLTSVLRETDEVDLQITGGAAPTLDLVLVPHPETSLASFVAAQQPSKLDLADQLPESPGAFVVTGHFVLGPYRDAVKKLLAAIYGPTGKDVLGVIEAVANHATGELAVGVRPSPLVVLQLFEIDDGAAVDATLGKLVELFATPLAVTTGTASVTYKALPAADHAGVPLHLYETTIDTAKMTPRTQQLFPSSTWTTAVAAFDKRLAVGYGGDAVADAGRMIEAVRNTGPRYAPPKELAAARDRKDSLFAALVGAGAMATASIGFTDHALHLRANLPVPIVRALVNQTR
jgi:hypothetical protein